MPDLQVSARALAPPLPLDLARSALFLDIDGTLLDLKARPEDVVADASVCALLSLLQKRMDGAVAVLTGRSMMDADRVLGRSIACVGALHGQQCRTGDTIERQAPPGDAWLRAKDMVSRLVADGALAGDLEDKGDALALHYRAHPERGPLIARAIDEIAARHGVRALHGKMVSEIMPVGATKGDALALFMRTPQFAGRVPIAVGDDLTDEDAFAAANALHGASVLVGDRADTKARFALPDAAAVRAWLAAAL